MEGFLRFLAENVLKADLGATEVIVIIDFKTDKAFIIEYDTIKVVDVDPGDGEELRKILDQYCDAHIYVFNRDNELIYVGLKYNWRPKYFAAYDDYEPVCEDKSTSQELINKILLEYYS